MFHFIQLSDYSVYRDFVFDIIIIICYYLTKICSF